MNAVRFHTRRRIPPIFRWLVLVVMTLVATALLWAHVTIMPQIIRAPGQIAPLGALHSVEHFEGGVIEKLSVKPGDAVKKGQILAVLHQPDVIASATRLRQSLMVSTQDVNRLEAILEFLGAATILPPAYDADTVAGLYQDAQIALYLSKKDALEARSERAQNSLIAARRVTDTMGGRVAALQSRQSRSQELFDRGLVTRAALEQVLDLIEVVRSEALQAEIGLLDAENQYSDTLSAIEAERIALQKQIQAELHATRNKVIELETELAVLDVTLQRSNVYAAVNGTVQTIEAATLGKVVPRGGEIMTILSAEDRLVAKIKLSPKDIGHVEPGMPAKISITTFDVRRFGHLTGSIATISPTSELNPQQEPFYEVVIDLDPLDHRDDGAQIQLRAGMEISGELLSDSQTLLSYFVGPIQRAIEKSFTERG